MSTSWTFFTNHAHVLSCISEDPDIRTRDISDRVGITQRASQRIIAELEEAGYLRHERIGRRNHYQLLVDTPPRNPREAHIGIGDLLVLLGPSIADR